MTDTPTSDASRPPRLGVLALVLAFVSLPLSISGWFSVGGLLLGVPALLLACWARFRPAVIVALGSVAIALVWQAAGGVGAD